RRSVLRSLSLPDALPIGPWPGAAEVVLLLQGDYPGGGVPQHRQVELVGRARGGGDGENRQQQKRHPGGSGRWRTKAGRNGDGRYSVGGEGWCGPGDGNPRAPGTATPCPDWSVLARGWTGGVPGRSHTEGADPVG